MARGAAFGNRTGLPQRSTLELRQSFGSRSTKSEGARRRALTPFVTHGLPLALTGSEQEMLTCRPVVLLNRATCADRTDTPLMKASILSFSSRVFGSGVIRSAGVAALLGLSALACEPGGVGDPCISEAEYEPGFSGFDADEVDVESKSFQCETRLCLVNHFKGRASCPYGQNDPSDPTLADGRECFIPGSRLPEDRIQVAVEPQDSSRRPTDAVYCSCRCANIDGSKDDGARYCECPSGYDCEKLIPFNLSGGQAQLTGFYCIKQGSQYTGFEGTECDPIAADCPEEE
jgi:hypothetical protein